MDPFEEGYTKIASLGELPEGTPRVFRSGGGMLVLRRTGEQIEALDGSCFRDDRATPSEARLQKILDCIADHAGSSSSEWEELVSRVGLMVQVVDGAIWVCVDQC